MAKLRLYLMLSCCCWCLAVNAAEEVFEAFLVVKDDDTQFVIRKETNPAGDFFPPVWNLYSPLTGELSERLLIAWPYYYDLLIYACDALGVMARYRIRRNDFSHLNSAAGP